MNRDRRDAGFTLLELLVAMTVLGVLTALLASGLNFGTRVWERERTQLDAASELQLVQDVLRRMIAQAIPLPPPTDGNAGAPESSFVGTDTSVRFLGPPPAQSLAGGIYAYRLQTSPHDGGVRLELEWRLLPPKMTKARPRVSNAAPEEADRLLSDQQVILLDHLSSAEFSFFGPTAAGAAAAWRNEWRGSATLPQMVRLKIAFPQGDRRIWPDLVVAPRIVLESSE